MVPELGGGWNRRKAEVFRRRCAINREVTLCRKSTRTYPSDLLPSCA